MWKKIHNIHHCCCGDILIQKNEPSISSILMLIKNITNHKMHTCTHTMVLTSSWLACQSNSKFIFCEQPLLKSMDKLLGIYIFASVLLCNSSVQYVHTLASMCLYCARLLCSLACVNGFTFVCTKYNYICILDMYYSM